MRYSRCFFFSRENVLKKIIRWYTQICSTIAYQPIRCTFISGTNYEVQPIHCAKFVLRYILNISTQIVTRMTISTGHKSPPPGGAASPYMSSCTTHSRQAIATLRLAHHVRHRNNKNYYNEVPDLRTRRNEPSIPSPRSSESSPNSRCVLAYI